MTDDLDDQANELLGEFEAAHPRRPRKPRAPNPEPADEMVDEPGVPHIPGMVGTRGHVFTGHAEGSGSRFVPEGFNVYQFAPGSYAARREARRKDLERRRQEMLRSKAGPEGP
jgi:hypothetical protein